MAPDVRRKERVEQGLSSFLHACNSGDASIYKEHIDASEFSSNTFDQLSCLICVTGIGPHDLRLGQLLLGGIDTSFTCSCNDDTGTLFPKELCRCCSDTTSAAGDKRDFSL